MKNYSSIDLDNMDIFDGLLSQSYSPEEVEDSGNFDEFVDAAREVRDTTGQCTNKKYSESILDTVFPSELAASLKSRDMLKQKMEDCFAEADEHGEEAQTELGRRMDDFHNWCVSNFQSKKKETSENIVPMTTSRYNGTAKRAFNTRHMM